MIFDAASGKFMPKDIATDISLANYAPLASPAFTGHPTGVTEAPSTNNTRLATTAYADAAVAAIPAKVPLVSAPAHFNSTGTAGQFAVDASNFYVCLATNSWVQVSSAGVFSTAF